MSERREELTRVAARLFAERGYQGTSLADIADALGMQKPSLYHHIASKEDLLWAVAWEGAEAFHAALDSVPMVVIAGDVPTHFHGKHPHQEVNLHADASQLEIFRPFVKRAWRVDQPDLWRSTSQLHASVLRRTAWIVAMGEHCGPPL